MANEVRVRFDAQDNVSAQATKIGSVVKGALLGIGVAAGFAAVRLAGDLTRALGVDAVNAASDFEESLNKAREVFGAAAEDVEEFANRAAVSIGASKDQALEMTATLGNLLSATGATGQEAADMSTRMVTLAADFASFNNLAGGTEEALLAIRSGLVGEAEPLRRLGVLLSETRVQQKGLELGLASSAQALTQQDKLLARYAIILEDSGQAQGDFARTSEGLANQQRILRAEFRDMQIEVGQKLAPAMLELVRVARDLIPVIGEVAKAFADAIIWAKDFGQALGELARDIAEFIGVAQGLETIPDEFQNAQTEINALQAQLAFAFSDMERGMEGAQDTASDLARELLDLGAGPILMVRDNTGQAVEQFDLAAIAAGEFDTAIRSAGAGAGVAAGGIATAGQALLGLTAQALAARVAAGEIDLGEAFKIAGAAQELRGTAAVIQNILAPAFMDLVPNIAGVTGQGKAWAEAMAGVGRQATSTGGAIRDLNNELVNFQPPINQEAWRVWREAEEAIRAAKIAEDEFNETLGVQILSLSEIERLQKELGRLAAERTRALAQAQMNVGQVDEFGNIIVGTGPNATGGLGGTRLLTPEQLREAQRTGGSVTTNYGTIQIILPNATDIDSALAEADLLAQG